jgi:hypothetical protein
MPKHSICILIPYFGRLPEWFSLYFETLKRNETIDFLFFTDCDTAAFQAPNVKFHQMTFGEYVDLVNSRADLGFAPLNAYKLCDLRPFFGLVHYLEIRTYDFYGYCDVDLFLGDIRSFYTNVLLKKFDVFSTHEQIISGHFALFRNTPMNRTMGFELGGWKEKLHAKEHLGIDELMLKAYRKVYLRVSQMANPLLRFLHSRRLSRLFLREQYTSPFTPIPWLDGSLNSAQPDIWYYRDGKITNSRDGNREFMYLHFMNFKSSKYRHDNTPAPWEGKPRICFATPEDMKKGIKISPEGIFPA